MNTDTATAPRPANTAHRAIAADPCGECDALAGVICEPYCPASLGVELVALEEPRNLEALVCPCGNACHLDGFVPVTADGAFAGECGEAWRADGNLVACDAPGCGRYFSELALTADGVHAQVLGTVATPIDVPDRW